MSASNDTLNNILTGLKEALEEINEDNEYNLNVKDVDCNFIFSDDEDYPAILIVLDDGIYDEEPSDTSNVFQGVALYGYVKSDRLLQTQMVNFRKDIVRCIGKNRTLGGAVHWVEIKVAGPADIFPGGFGMPPGFNNPYGCIKIMLMIEYQIDNNEGG